MLRRLLCRLLSDSAALRRWVPCAPFHQQRSRFWQLLQTVYAAGVCISGGVHACMIFTLSLYVRPRLSKFRQRPAMPP